MASGEHRTWAWAWGSSEYPLLPQRVSSGGSKWAWGEQWATIGFVCSVEIAGLQLVYIVNKRQTTIGFGVLAIFRDDRRQRRNGLCTHLTIFRRKPRAINMFTMYTKSRFHVHGMTQNRTYLTEATRVAMYTWLRAPCRLNFGAKPTSGIQESTEAGQFIALAH